MRLRISWYRWLWIAFAASVALPWAGCGSEDTPTTSTGTTTGPGAGPGGAGGSGGAGGPGGAGGAGGAGATGGAGGAGGSVTCGSDEKECGGQCVTVDDPQYGCGAGCAPCDLPNADPLCSGGACQIGTCDPGFADCNADDADGCEIEIGADPDNCNACGNQCVTPNAEPQCVAGACAVGMCQAPYEDCDADPANGCEALVGSDPQHCAACNMPCAPGEQCQAGVCGVFCAPGLANCDNDAVNGCETTLGTLTDCGFCGDACDLANATSACVGGACQVSACDPGAADCDGMADNGCETNTDGSALDCGGCGVVCPSGPHSTAICAQGACDLSCDGGFEDCDGNAANGCEAATTTDVQNCGGCGVVCPAQNGSPSCVAGQCGLSSCASGFSDCNGISADGCEVNTTTSTTHCGSCGNACPDPANGDATCSSGACGAACDQGWANCNGSLADGCEVNTTSDPAHCGSCGTTCNVQNGDGACIAGTCGIGACDPGWGNCNLVLADGCEANTDTELDNCGGCGLICLVANGTPTCTGGSCEIASCNPGAGDCNNNPLDGCEVNTSGNANHCGTCGNVCVIANGSPLCSAGVCQVGSCNAGWTNCDGSAGNGCEIHTAVDVLNCGACGNACAVANATPSCSGGACGIASCNSGFGNCDSNVANGCEVNTQTSVTNCGACGNTCTVANGTPACSGGACAIAACNANFADCDGNVANGCETNLLTSVGNCGGCGNACSVANGTPACSGGACAISSCNPGFSSCDGNVANGCEVNTQTSVGNCGSCGNVCSVANGSPSCAGGACGIASCNSGYSNCDGNVANGCEVNTQTSVGNCGACGNVCSVANGNPSCTGGACGIASCNAGNGNCDGNVANGCETNLLSSVGNCGACGNTCSVANGTPACAGGACAVLSCNAGWGNCDSNPANGCETNTQTSATHCGGCGNTCSLPNAVAACSAGGCVVASCNPGFANCDGIAANGCEVNTQTSVGNCGACGNTCSVANGTAACLSGSCAVAGCNPGFANCDGSVANGCEVNTQTSVGNCGGCGNACSVANGTPACSSGSCAVSSCNAGFQNCDGVVSNGCEINTTTDVNNCGGCGNACGAVCTGNVTSTVCGGGVCSISGCAGSYNDTDGICTTGCECQSSNVSSSCTLPAALGTVNLGQTITTSANLVPTGKENWYVVSFTGNANASYHPRVRFTSNPGNAFRFDIRTNCSGGTMACGTEGGVSNSVTDWETFKPAANGYNNVIPPVGNNGTILIRVYRAGGMPVTCDSYTLTISN